MNIKRRPFAFDDLHAEVRFQFSALAEDLALAYQSDRTEFRFEPFEGLRSPDRQNHLFTEGTTKARAWQSAHQFGFAVDFVARDPYSLEWSWKDDEDWDLLHTMARDFGLHAPIKWDKPHIESPLFKEYIKQLP